MLLNQIVHKALTCWGIGKRGGQEVTMVKPLLHISSTTCACVYHLPSVSSVKACGVGGEDGKWISSSFGASSNVNERDKIHHFVYGHALIFLQCTCIALQPDDVHLSLYDVSSLHRMFIASILRVNEYTYLIPVSFLGLADFSSIEEVRGEETGSLWGVTAVGKRNWLVVYIEKTSRTIIVMDSNDEI